MKAVLYRSSNEHWLRQFPIDFPQLHWSVFSTPADAAPQVSDADILVLTNRACAPELGEVLRRHAGPQLKWIHFTTAGFDRGVAMGLPPGAAITNAAGVKATMVAEHAMALLLALVRRLPDIQAGQRAHQWRREETCQMSTLEGATVCIVGLGKIGCDVARKLKAFNARVIAVSRAAPKGGDVAAVFSRERTGEALTMADAVVICTSGDDTSRHLINAAALAQMKPSAVIVNVARGTIIDEPALIEALRGGRLAGAALDVQAVEPLPSDSPLWDLPSVIVSPHSAGSGSTGYAQHKALFAQNLKRFRAGQPLLNDCTATAHAQAPAA